MLYKASTMKLLFGFFFVLIMVLIGLFLGYTGLTMNQPLLLDLSLLILLMCCVAGYLTAKNGIVSIEVNGKSIQLNHLDGSRMKIDNVQDMHIEKSYVPRGGVRRFLVITAPDGKKTIPLVLFSDISQMMAGIEKETGMLIFDKELLN